MHSVIIVHQARNFNYVFCHCTSTKELESVENGLLHNYVRSSSFHQRNQFIDSTLGVTYIENNLFST